MTVSNESIKQLAADHGFTQCGTCDANPSNYADHFRAWLAAGKHGEMTWLADNIETRLDPRKLLAGAKSIIMLADLLPKPQTTAPGRIARYAQISDYHRVMKKRLLTMCDALRQQYPNENFRACVDTAPLMEREHAQRAGLGWTGKHTLLLNENMGSHMMLGAILTTLAITPDSPAADHCGTCTRCIDACPTDAITPYSLDATRCISYLTIEHRSEIDPRFHQAIGDWIFGCDICQDVCPYVKRADPPADPPPGYKRHHATLHAPDVLDWDEDDRRAAFQTSAMKRAKLDMIRRNALIVAANHLREHDDASLRNRIQEVADDPNESLMLRHTAQNLLHHANRGQ